MWRWIMMLGVDETMKSADEKNTIGFEDKKIVNSKTRWRVRGVVKSFDGRRG